MTRRTVWADGPSTKPTAKGSLSNRQTLGLIALAGLTTLLLAVVPGLDLLNYPFRLLITLVHELGHGLAAILTGGDFVRFIVNIDGSGLAYTSGGWRLIVIPAGYLGVALFGGLLIMLGRSHRGASLAMGAIGLVMIIFSLRYGIPSVFSGEFLGGLVAVVSGVVFGAVFLLVAWRATPGAVIFLLHVVAIQAGLTAFADIVAVLGMSAPFNGGPRTDAISMAELTLIPAIVWAGLWAITALVLIGGAIWLTWLQPEKK
jgi:hypothetical protein